MKVLKKIAVNTRLHISKLCSEKKKPLSEKNPEWAHYQQTFTQGESEEYARKIEGGCQKIVINGKLQHVRKTVTKV